MNRNAEFEDLVRSVAGRSDDAPPGIALELWEGLRPEIRRRAARHRRRQGGLTLALMLFCFTVGWYGGGLGSSPSGLDADIDAARPGAEDPLLALQSAGADFIARLAAIRGEAEQGQVAPQTLEYAEISGLTLLNGAATELARLSREDGLPAELARLSSPGPPPFASEGDSDDE